MDKKADSNISKKVNANIVDQLAALMYYDQFGPSDKVPDFEKLEPEDQKKWKLSALKFMVMIDKLNKQIVDKVDAQLLADKESRALETLTALIKDFVSKLKHPEGVAKFFPSEELARRILRGA